MTAYEKALQSLWLNRADVLVLARQAVEAGPESTGPRLLEALILASSESERAHAAALAATLDGDLAGACRIYDAILQRDILHLTRGAAASRRARSFKGAIHAIGLSPRAAAA